MTKTMLIDASQPEETRVAVLTQENKLHDIEFKSSIKDTIKGNIYLAKVARVEPSLQAVFVDYGGNRHGFLAFNEIHPDYFRIPVDDREALQKEMEEALKDQEPSEGLDDGERAEDEESEDIVATKRLSLHKRYKIQEVIHKNQILLVQVVKEERANKGAALTTFLSFAGRYCVLMPNSPRSGGVSRKITHQKDRKKLKDVLESFDIPRGMGLIIRTAGQQRTRTELKRDAQYLMRLWDDIRETTLSSHAPALIQKEGDLIKRAVRDFYTKDIEKIMVEGEEGYKQARPMMGSLMPSHTRRVHRYRGNVPLFHAYGVEHQIEDLYSTEVHLASGGSLVIQPTEALVSIDINSGRSTRERDIEETAKKTNLEAAQEIARQVRLRELAGLIVIDFIDMSEPRHLKAVEKKLKDSFKDDRARILIGSISPFGLLEMSRKRLGPSLLETNARPCHHCQSTGFVRSVESSSLRVLRMIEEEGQKNQGGSLSVKVTGDVLKYLLNNKRLEINALQERHGVHMLFDTLEPDQRDPVISVVATGQSMEVGAASAKINKGAASQGLKRLERPEEAKEAPKKDHHQENKNRPRRGRDGGKHKKKHVSQEGIPSQEKQEGESPSKGEDFSNTKEKPLKKAPSTDHKGPKNEAKTGNKRKPSGGETKERPSQNVASRDRAQKQKIEKKEDENIMSHHFIMPMPKTEVSASNHRSMLIDMVVENNLEKPLSKDQDTVRSKENPKSFKKRPRRSRGKNARKSSEEMMNPEQGQGGEEKEKTSWWKRFLET